MLALSLLKHLIESFYFFEIKQDLINIQPINKGFQVYNNKFINFLIDVHKCDKLVSSEK